MLSRRQLLLRAAAAALVPALARVEKATAIFGPVRRSWIYVLSATGAVIARVPCFADGANDDTPSLQKAMEIAYLHGNHVQLPAGDYHVKALPFPTPVPLVGEGPKKTVLRAVARNEDSAVEGGGEH